MVSRLRHVGPEDTTTGTTPARPEHITSVNAQGLTQAQVDARISNQLSAFATTSYVDQQDQLNATKAFVDQQDNLLQPTSTRGAAGGVAVPASGTLMAANKLTNYTYQRTKGLYSPTSYVNGGSVGLGGRLTLATLSIPYPGWPFRIWVWGYWECLATSCRPEVSVRVGSTTGTIIGQGKGYVNPNHVPVNVFPCDTAASPFTSAQTLYFVGTATSGIGSGTAGFTSYMANAVAFVVPANS